MKKQITVASLIMGIGGLFVLIFSFLDFTARRHGVERVDGDLLFPATIIPVIFGVATWWSPSSSSSASSCPTRC